jgi:uncharacterized protein
MSKREDFVQQYGPWAVVTGASSGLGAEFAKQLSGAGLNVVLVARREERLYALAKELEQTYSIMTRVVAADLSDQRAASRLADEVSDLEVGLLISNAGSGAPGAFLKQELEDRTRIIQLNVLTSMQLAYQFGERMIARNHGGIIFVSSLSAYMGTPYMANYAATKSYLLNLGEGLHVEFKKGGVDVTVLVPGPTRTEMADQEGMDFSRVPMNWMEVTPVVQTALNRLGKQSVVVAGRINRLMTFMVRRLLPSRQASAMFGRLMARSMSPDLL